MSGEARIGERFKCVILDVPAGFWSDGLVMSVTVHSRGGFCRSFWSEIVGYLLAFVFDPPFFSPALFVIQ